MYFQNSWIHLYVSFPKTRENLLCPFCDVVLFPAHTIKHPLLTLIKVLSDVEPVQLLDLTLSEEETRLIVSKKTSCASHRGVRRLQKVLQQAELAGPVCFIQMLYKTKTKTKTPI